MNKPKVWVIKEQMVRTEIGTEPMDYTPAMRYGDLEFVTHGDMPLYGRSDALRNWHQDMFAFAAEYDQERDYIITTGQPAAFVVAGWYLGRANKVPRFLVWRREEGMYRVVNFDTCGVF